MTAAERPQHAGPLDGSSAPEDPSPSEDPAKAESGEDLEHLHVVGPGRMGLALGYALDLVGGVRSITYCGRRPEAPDHPLFQQGHVRYVHGLEAPRLPESLVILAVPDGLLPEVGEAFAARGAAPPAAVALHLSGALGADVLAPLHRQGYGVGAFHPMQAVADPRDGPAALRGGFYSISGEPAALAVARRVVDRLQGRSLEVPHGGRGLYHAAAVTASNHLVTIMAAARDLLVQAGAPEDRALDALVALARGTLDNVERLGPEGALTGPVRRGDVETVDLHLRLLEGDERRFYTALARETVRILGDRTESHRRDALLERLHREDDQG